MGGQFNTAGVLATIGGGYQNLATGIGSFIGGGGYDGNGSGPNVASGNGSVIAGGEGNQANDYGSTIGGGYFNLASEAYTCIGGGYNNQAYGQFDVIAGGNVNQIYSDNGSICGGDQNLIQTNADHATIGGGYQNIINNNAAYSFIGGGYQNLISINAVESVIAGGYQNNIGSAAIYGTIAGGQSNYVNAQSATIGGGFDNFATDTYATVGGGTGNTADGLGSVVGGGTDNHASGTLATIPGGLLNLTSGNFTFAAGNRAQAIHDGAFVWSDAQSVTPFSSTTNNEFSIRALNGVRISTDKGIHLNAADRPMITRDWDPFTTNAPSFKAGIGRWGMFMEQSFLTLGIPGDNFLGLPRFQIVKYSTNGTSIQLVMVDQSGNMTVKGTVTANSVLLTSDRNAKENFTTLDSRAMLAKVAALPLTQWNYKTDGQDVQHVGPMAQDFQAAFGLDGADDKHINVVDEGGVALAAIQGLNQKLNEKDAEIEALKQSVTELKMAVRTLSEKK